MRTQLQACVGGRQSLGRAREQGHAQRAFEFVNMTSHRRLGQTKLAAGTREIALAHHREKGTPPLPADVVFHYAKMYSGYAAIANLFWPNPDLIVQSCWRLWRQRDESSGIVAGPAARRAGGIYPGHRHRWRSGRTVSGLSPRQERRALCDPERERPGRRFLARPLGFAAVVHAGAVRWA